MPGKEETAALPEAAQPFDVDGNGVLDEVEVATMLAAMGNPQGRSPSSVT
jgi:Ca2+-binding EF-hand superfamily protein